MSFRSAVTAAVVSGGNTGSAILLSGGNNKLAAAACAAGAVGSGLASLILVAREIANRISAQPNRPTEAPQARAAEPPSPHLGGQGG